MSSFVPVQSVLRALDLLAEVNRTSLATVGDLHRRTGLPKPTIVRLLETLMAAGYVVRHINTEATIEHHWATNKLTYRYTRYRVPEID